MRASSAHLALSFALALFAGACAPGGSADGDSGDTSSESNTESESESESDADSDAGSEAATTSDDSPFPPGCTDGGPPSTAQVWGADQILWANMFVDCEGNYEPGDNCSWDEYIAIITVPGLTPGSYDLSDLSDEVHVEITNYWDHDQSEAGCYCVDEASTTPIPIESGTLIVGESPSADWSFTLELVDAPSPLGSFSTLVEPAC